MIEEIKEEILKLEQTGGLFSKEKGIISEPKVNVVEVLAILDKYNNQEKQTTIFIDTEDMEERYGTDLYIQYLESYKKAFEELKEYITKENITIQGIEVLEQEDLIDKMQELEQKYNIGGE